MFFFLFSDRLPRRSGDIPGSRERSIVLVDSDLSRLPLPDLVLSAVEQLPAPTPQVTVSAPNSPTRDAAFQFPECNAPVPSPRPKPRRRRLTSESAIPDKGPSDSKKCNSSCCSGHLNLCTTLKEREWVTVGANLRNIADDFHAARTKVFRGFFLSQSINNTYLMGKKLIFRENLFVFFHNLIIIRCYLHIRKDMVRNDQKVVYLR